MPDLKLYTVAQLRDWLMHNNAAEGLSEKIIAPARAWAIIHNPYVKDEDSVVAAIVVKGEIAAYTSAFPDMINGKCYWWFSALWCNPAMRGNGYGLVVIGSLAEIYGVENCLDRWGAPDTVEIFTYLGHQTIYSQRYMSGVKIDRKTPKGKLVYFVRSVQKMLHKFIERPLNKEVYTLNYLSHIDDKTYCFIQSHRGKDYFIHTQDFMNWVLRYPLSISAPLIERTLATTSFSPSETPNTQLYAVQVTDNGELIGFYLMKHKEECLHVLYLYYNNDRKQKVFASIRDHVKRLYIAQCVTENPDLAGYLRNEIYFPKNSMTPISFSYPKSFECMHEGMMQYGDGDSFIV